MSCKLSIFKALKLAKSLEEQVKSSFTIEGGRAFWFSDVEGL